MKQNAKNKVNQQVYRRFPSLNGTRPKIQAQKTAKSSKSSNTYLFTYKGSAKVSGNKKLPLIVRVVSTEDGKILKLSTSR